ncbi:MAG: hypothetical protein AAGU19_16275 [Prolixibacteraceae bacterium]
MKAKIIIPVIALLLFLSGCVVFSFYPLYTDNDLFANDLLVGEWVDGDSAVWKFDFHYNGRELPENRDSTAFILRIKEKGSTDFEEAKMMIHIVKLGGTYFLDFYASDYLDTQDLNLRDFHLMPVHSFAKLDIKGDKAVIRWFNPEWLQDLIKQNRIRIHHERNDDYILLTAQTAELQKFVLKYVNSAEAFDEGLDAKLHRIRK